MEFKQILRQERRRYRNSRVAIMGFLAGVISGGCLGVVCLL